MASVLSEAFRSSRPHAVCCSAPLNSGAVTPKKKKESMASHTHLSQMFARPLLIVKQSTSIFPAAVWSTSTNLDGQQDWVFV